MAKKELLNRLHGMTCRYAELVVELCSNGRVVFPRKRIIVSISQRQDYGDFPSRTYTIYDSVDDFVENSAFSVGEAQSNGKRYYYGQVHEIAQVN